MATRKPETPHAPLPPPAPPRRETIEVEASWLDPADDEAVGPRKATTKAMPRVSKSALPRFPGPPRRETMEVQADWLEADEPVTTGSGTGAVARRVTRADGRAVRPSQGAMAKIAGPPPLPQLAPPSAPSPTTKANRGRQAWEPPPLPPPPATAAAARPRKALPPPLPREEEEPARPDPRRSPPKAPQR